MVLTAAPEGADETPPGSSISGLLRTCPGPEEGTGDIGAGFSGCGNAPGSSAAACLAGLGSAGAEGCVVAEGSPSGRPAWMVCTPLEFFLWGVLKALSFWGETRKLLQAGPRSASPALPALSWLHQAPHPNRLSLPWVGFPKNIPLTKYNTHTHTQGRVTGPPCRIQVEASPGGPALAL